MSKSKLINRSLSKRHIGYAITLTTIITLPTIFFVGYYARKTYPSGATHVFEHSITGASYVIWTDGSTYYRRNGSTGEVSSGTNASQIMNNVIGTGGVTLFLKNGIYNLDSSILIQNRGTWIIGENRENTILNLQHDNIYGIKIQGLSNEVMGEIKISNLHINGTGASHTKSAIYTYRMWYSTLENLLITYTNHGIYMDGTWTERGARNLIFNVKMQNLNGNGIYAKEQDSSTIISVTVANLGGRGVVLEEKTQGFVLEAVRIDDAGLSGMYLQDVQGLRVTNTLISDSGTYGIIVTGGSSGLYFLNLYIESSTSDQIYITNTYPWSNYDIAFTNMKLVRGQATGIKFVGDNGKNTSYVNVLGSTIANNGQQANNTFAGIYGHNATFYVRIEDTFIGNFPLETGNYYQKGIQSANDCDHWLILGTDVSTAVNNKPISLVGANSQVNHSWNGTSWIP